MKRPTLIHKALLKYGYSNFSFEILEYCEKKDVIQREQHYFDLCKPEYNILKVAGSPLGRKHSEETLERMRTLHLHDEEVRQNRIKARLGFKITEDTRQKISAATTSRIGVPVLVKNIVTGVEIEYENLTKAGLAIGVSRTAVKKALDLNKCLKSTYMITKIN